MLNTLAAVITLLLLTAIYLELFQEKLHSLLDLTINWPNDDTTEVLEARNTTFHATAARNDEKYVTLAQEMRVTARILATTARIQPETSHQVLRLIGQCFNTHLALPQELRAHATNLSTRRLMQVIDIQLDHTDSNETLTRFNNTLRWLNA